MSGNSGDSFSDDSDGEVAEKEEVKVEVAVAKKKGPGRPPRKKRGPVPTPVNTMLPVSHKRRCVQPKSGKDGGFPLFAFQWHPFDLSLSNKMKSDDILMSISLQVILLNIGPLHL